MTSAARVVRNVEADDAAGLRPGERLINLDDALELAERLHRAGHLDDAEAIYGAVLERRPDDPVALHLSGVLRHQLGDSARGAALIERAIALRPQDPAAHNNLGNVLLEAGDVERAIDAYRACLALAPDFADTHNNLGTIHRARREHALAEACYLRAIAIRPDFVDAHNNMANLMLAQRRIDEAVIWSCKAVTLDPRHASARRVLGMAHCSIGEYDKAADVYRAWLADEPDNPLALHHLAACTGEQVPARAADAYVESTFDGFAASFDAKLAKLDYRAPELVAAAARARCGRALRALDVLDAGCGTGLCGPLVREHARRLEGVDLSQGMLNRAAARAAYDALHRAELGAFLATHAGAFDLIVSADTLCYFGVLDDLLRHAASALRGEGLVVFTLEALIEGAGFRLQPHGRYCHARGYVEETLHNAGLETLSIEQHVLRQEGGLPVAGWLVAARRKTAWPG